tara:strand:+ start:247 stop:1122 length:876 start_codon:yes stop_codon:yes gene_type:complete
MKKILLLLLFIPIVGFSQEDVEYTDEEIERIIFFMDSVESSMNYQKGNIQLEGGIATLKVPYGYKFLGKKQSEYVNELWGNPPSEFLGMLFLEKDSIFTQEYVVFISYSEEGFISDDEANEMDYDELMEDLIESDEETNKEREKLGFAKSHCKGWASEPYFDDKNKKLHWAFEFNFEGDESNTLNYKVLSLGREGFIEMNIASDMNSLSLVKADVNNLLSSIEFNKGYRYSEFNSSTDKIAAYGIGGLIAGKVLAKAGFFVVLLKFWKIIMIFFVGVFAIFKKRIFGKKDK